MYSIAEIKKPTVKKRSGSAALLLLLITIAIVISSLTRALLTLKSAASIDFSASNLARIFLIGLFYDLISSLYLVIPLLTYLWLVSSKQLTRKGHRITLYILFSIFTFALLFNAVSEWLFWVEFSARYNFIAVDYLIYTGEVIGNIRQSYPVGWIIAAIAILTFLIVRFALKPIIDANHFHTKRFKTRSAYLGGYLLLVTGIYFLVSSGLRKFSDNAYLNELAGNGLYELFAAYRNNELDYHQFYEQIPDRKAFELARDLIHTPESKFINTEDPYSIERTITNIGVERKMNVVLISVESLSADFLGSFGNTQHITPFLDSLAKESLLFTNLYATGTRTVRGLEALSICTPPTPGQSIVRRPHNEGLFSAATVFKKKGYQCKFIYGGYSYFDNMGYFFKNNAYEVSDRVKLKKKEIAYENVWGVADENLFTLATREIESGIKAGRPVFAHIMTTSNHRPFTYPDGRIDIPSHTSREGAVKYTDFAIGQFIRTSSRKAWFKNTLFVIVADHCASSAGKTDLPVSKYKIPLLIYAPGFVEPRKMDRLMSQIDLIPTILGLLNFSYTSKFFGYDIFKLEPGRERAFISTYQNLGYIKGDTCIVLKPQRVSQSFIVDRKSDSTRYIGSNRKVTDEAISYYQTASYLFKHRLMR